MADGIWDSLSDMMSRFHEHFKTEFNELYELADGSFNRHGMSLGMYLRKATNLNRTLTMHHTIEERQIFPFLAKKMPQFSVETDDAHIASHRGIHDGLDELGTLVHKWKQEPSSYSPAEMRTCLDGFREVLFKHLDQEVLDLKGENLKKYWERDEILPFLRMFNDYE